MCDGTFGKTVLPRFAADNLRPLHATNAICVGFKVAISPTHGCQPRATGRELEAVNLLSQPRIRLYENLPLLYSHSADRTNAPAHLGSHCGLHVFLRLRRPPGARRKSTGPARRSTGAAGIDRRPNPRRVTDPPTLTAPRGRAPSVLRFWRWSTKRAMWPKFITDISRILLLRPRKNSAGQSRPRSAKPKRGAKKLRSGLLRGRLTVAQLV